MAIPAEDLRKGNLVFDRGGKTLRIDWFEREKVCMRMDVNGSEVHPLTEDFKHIEPIPITDVLFERFGFLKDGAYWSHLNLNLSTEEKTDGGCAIMVPNNKYASELKYVHQLQNLYFSLVGLELTLK